MQPEPPLPLWATFRPATNRFYCRFDRALRADPAINVGNWILTTVPGTFRSGLLLAARGSSVFGVMQPTLGGPNPGTCRYSPPPFDVFGRLGGVAPAFDNFPITILV